MSSTMESEIKDKATMDEIADNNNRSTKDPTFEASTEHDGQPIAADTTPAVVKAGGEIADKKDSSAQGEDGMSTSAKSASVAVGGECEIVKNKIPSAEGENCESTSAGSAFVAAEADDEIVDKKDFSAQGENGQSTSAGSATLVVEAGGEDADNGSVTAHGEFSMVPTSLTASAAQSFVQITVPVSGKDGTEEVSDHLRFASFAEPITGGHGATVVIYTTQSYSTLVAKRKFCLHVFAIKSQPSKFRKLLENKTPEEAQEAMKDLGFECGLSMHVWAVYLYKGTVDIRLTLRIHGHKDLFNLKVQAWCLKLANDFNAQPFGQLILGEMLGMWGLRVLTIDQVREAVKTETPQLKDFFVKWTNSVEKTGNPAQRHALANFRVDEKLRGFFPNSGQNMQGRGRRSHEPGALQVNTTNMIQNGPNPNLMSTESSKKKQGKKGKKRRAQDSGSDWEQTTKGKGKKGRKAKKVKK